MIFVYHNNLQYMVPVLSCTELPHPKPNYIYYYDIFDPKCYAIFSPNFKAYAK